MSESYKSDVVTFLTEAFLKFWQAPLLWERSMAGVSSSVKPASPSIAGRTSAFISRISYGIE